MRYSCENYNKQDCGERCVCKIKLPRCPYGTGKVTFTPAILIDKDGTKIKEEQ